MNRDEDYSILVDREFVRVTNNSNLNNIQKCDYKKEGEIEKLNQIVIAAEAADQYNGFNFYFLYKCI